MLYLMISQAFAPEAQKIVGIWWNWRKDLEKFWVREGKNGKFYGTIISII